MRIAFVGDSHGQVLGPRLKKLLGDVAVIANPGWSEARYAGVRLPAADLIVYQLGGNNFHLEAARYRRDVEFLLRAAGSTPVLWIGPATATEPATSRRHEATAKLQAALLPELGIEWMDARPLTRTGHRSDGVHFDAATYARWADAIAARVRSLRLRAAPRPRTWIALVAAAAVALIAARRLL